MMPISQTAAPGDAPPKAPAAAVSPAASVAAGQTIPTWEECRDAGMTGAEAARARGKKRSAASAYAKRHGLIFMDGRRGESTKASSSARLKALNADPAKSPHRHLHAMTETERADYATLKRAGYSKFEALRAIGRADLVAP